ncbi:MAG: hypothetical protein R2751_02780 [Bacteroidales bacterium]
MKTIIALVCLLSGAALSAQQTAQMGGIDWQLEGTVIQENYKGKECLKTNEGAAVARGIDFGNGILEFSMCIQPGRGFAGIRFHGEDGVNFEEFYVRTHQSGNPDAMQYTPVYNGNAGWQLYYGDGYSAATSHAFDTWFPVRLVIAGSRGEVYIGSMEEPVLCIHELKLGKRGGAIVLNGPARFADVRITPLEAPELKGSFKTIERAGEEVIQEYLVSELFDAESLMKESRISGDFLRKLQFETFQTEADGLLNLSRRGALGEGKNAVLLKINVHADSALIKRMDVGFSDVARVYVNGKVIWQGTDTYGSRDYRFLGTLGYFDSVFLDLNRGDNEILILVAENFGGWGFKARFENLLNIH